MRQWQGEVVWVTAGDMGKGGWRIQGVRTGVGRAGVGAGGEVTNRTQNMMPCTCYFTSLSQRATTQY